MVLEGLSSSLNGVSQELSRTYDRSFATDVPESFARIAIDTVQLETNQGAMPAVFGGVTGLAIVLSCSSVRWRRSQPSLA